MQHREKGIKLKPSKRKLFKKQVKCLGNIITAEGYRVDLSLTKPIIKFLGDPPRDITGAWGLILVLLGYNCRRIQNFSSVAWLPYDLLMKPVSGIKPVVNKSLIQWWGREERNTK